MAPHQIADAVYRRFSFLKTGGAAAAFSLLACIVFSSSANAATFTLAEVEVAGGFTIGNLEFFNWQNDETTANLNIVTLTTTPIDSVTGLGFVINGNGELEAFGNPQDVESDELLDYTFSVRTVDRQPLITGALLWMDDASAGFFSGVDITLADQGAPTDPLIDLNVSLIELDPDTVPVIPPPILADADSLAPPVDVLNLRNVTQVELFGLTAPAGPAVLNRYTTLFTVVPEPGTALMLGLGLAGLGVFGRSRREETA